MAAEMNATTFAKRRAKIEHQQSKPAWWRRKAHDALIREARAVVVTSGLKAVGWLLPNGETICIKTRFKSEDAALGIIAQINADPLRRDHQPTRAYACFACHGWHLTSEAKR
jgi:hypothetical protein